MRGVKKPHGADKFSFEAKLLNKRSRQSWFLSLTIAELNFFFFFFLKRHKDAEAQTPPTFKSAGEFGGKKNNRSRTSSLKSLIYLEVLHVVSVVQISAW